MAQQNVHASEGEIATWKRAAEAAGMSFNGWARLALTQRAELEAALERERLRLVAGFGGGDAEGE